MSEATKRSTVYFKPEIYRALRLKAAVTNRSLSDLVNEAVPHALREDQEDLAAFEERIAEPTLSYEVLLKNSEPMASFEILFKESVAKDFQHLPNKDVKRILERIEALRNDPRPASCEKFSAQERYRVRQRDYRIIYKIMLRLHTRV